jgi:hypothetical protein
VRPLSCARLSIGNVQEFLCWRWKPYPSCFRFAKMCLCQVSLLSRCSSRYLTSSSRESCTLLTWTGRGGTFLFV